MKIALLGGEPQYVLRFRGHLLRALQQRGHEVLALAGAADSEVAQELAQAGIRFAHFTFHRTGIRPDRELATLLALRRIFVQERPDLVITTTPKLIAYAGIAARLAGVTRRAALVTGLGMAFDPPQGANTRFQQFCAHRLLEAGLKRSSLVVFYNPDDQRMLRDLNLVSREQDTLLVAGSGIDTESFTASAVPSAPVTFLLLGRLLISKGVLDFIDAARLVKAEQPAVRFQLLGDLDREHPHSIGEAALRQAQQAGIEYLGYQRDVRPHLQAATVVVVPSQQREGLPRVILEAFASGRPVIASDIPGCHHAVVPGQTGWLVPARSAAALASVMREIASDPAHAAALGPTCRQIAEQRFSVDTITRQLITALGV